MGKGSGNSDCRPSINLTSVGSASDSAIHASVPKEFHKFLLETDMNKLKASLPKSSSYPEYQTIVFRMAQLNDEYAVDGLLSSSKYLEAKKKAEADKLKIEKAQAAYDKAMGKNKKFNDDQALEALKKTLYPPNWEEALREQALLEDPEFIALQEELKHQLLNESKVKKPRKRVGELSDLEKKFKLSLIKNGPLHKDTKELRTQIKNIKEGLEEEQAVEDGEKKSELLKQQIIDLQKAKLGIKVQDDAVKYHYEGGNLDIEQKIDDYHLEREVELNEMLAEEKLKASLSGAEKEKAALLLAEKKYEESNHVLLAHEAAINRAKKKAQLAKEKELIFEPQNINSSFVNSLKKHKGQARAVFLEDSVFKDNIVNIAHHKDDVFEIHALVDEAKESKMIKTLDGKPISYELENLPSYGSWASKEIGKMAAYEVKSKYGTITYTPRKPHSSKFKEAVHSEQGILRVHAKTPEDALKALTEAKLAKSVCKSVPGDEIYRGKHRFGHVTPLYEPLATGEEAVSLPDEHMIIHGLTGAGGNAKGHLENIIKSGGLKSIAERRRMNIKTQSMSPLGDIASGIDMGVPCKIGRETQYGGAIFFGMKPEAIERRDLWFSNVDFGGGHNRNASYQKYAKGLGQNDIHSPCPTEGRKKHLKNGLGATNEIYFRGEVSWNDVDTLFVANQSEGATIKEMVEKYKQNGLLPHHVRVEVVGSPPADAKKATTLKGKTPTNKAKISSSSGWTVTEDGKVVMLDTTDMEALEQETKSKKSWNINDHIRHRARVLARTI